MFTFPRLDFPQAIRIIGALILLVLGVLVCIMYSLLDKSLNRTNGLGKCMVWWCNVYMHDPRTGRCDGLVELAGVFRNQIRFQAGAHLLRHRAVHHAVLLHGFRIGATRVGPPAIAHRPLLDDVQEQLEPRIRARKILLHGRVSVLPLLQWHPQVVLVNNLLRTKLHHCLPIHI